MITFEVKETNDNKVVVTCLHGSTNGLAAVAMATNLRIAEQINADVKGNSMELNCTMEQLMEGMARRRRGALIQDAFPFLTADEREFLKSGLLPVQFDALYNEEE